ncbi:hypothetical protein [Kutzneria albida]|uniref:Uncharacterized protein n=1 Tax=Kutzneria albida DSM 43870 TaxID=1449976 RepID=W5WJQ3_9PSEU|nr:hypothetical protein [Kutzneria albida]AHI00976.1 hypothetical protein KALB_7618 [Kutzneria albida DSM 43870]
MPNDRGPLPLALIMAGGYLVAAALVGGTLLLAHGSTLVAGTAEPVATPTGAGPPAGYQRVDGPSGLHTVIPEGWRISTIRNGFQADDPAGGGAGGRFVRYQGVAADGDLYAWLTGYEQQSWTNQPAYKRILLARQDFTGKSAVRWEFTYTLDGQPRHVEILYWQGSGVQYDVYASAPASEWTRTKPIFDAMLSGTTS